jgi:predicted transposase YdaD
MAKGIMIGEIVKQSEEMGIRFMNAFEEKMMERREGETAKQLEIAERMLIKGLEISLIAEMTGLSKEKLEALQNKDLPQTELTEL